jgi:hypothetical protein
MIQFNIITPNETKVCQLCENEKCKLIKADGGVCFKLQFHFNFCMRPDQ